MTLFHNYKKEVPESEGDYILFFSKSGFITIATYSKHSDSFFYEIGCYVYDVYRKYLQEDVYYADINDFSEFLTNKIINDEKIHE